MSTQEFLSAPWKIRHQAYEESVFSIRPAPEFATAEVLVASTYRSVGFRDYTESKVPSAGAAFDKAASKSRQSRSDSVSPETWRLILHGALESPKQPKQSSRRFLQLCPVVPDTSLYSGSARLTGNSWDPGLLIQRMIVLGASTRHDAEVLWRRVYDSLSVDASDDVWARWLQKEFESRRPSGPVWAPTELAAAPALPDSERRGLNAPSVQFVRDLDAILRAKSHMTRRQWLSLVEAILRLGSVAHVLWLCDVNHRLWRAVRGVLDGSPVPSSADLERLVSESQDHFLVYGQPAVPIIRQLASRYLVSRLGLNLVLWNLSDLGHNESTLGSLEEASNFLQTVARNRVALNSKKVLSQLSGLEDSEARTLACKKGIGSNLVEFCRYTLGQRQTADQNLRGYDQGYELKKRGDYAAAPWVLSFGPVALLALVHCCLNQVAGPRSVQRLCEHLALYGLEVDMDNIAKSDLGHELRMLGLVLDSPDAESGMLLIPPFEVTINERETR